MNHLDQSRKLNQKLIKEKIDSFSKTVAENRRRKQPEKLKTSSFSSIESEGETAHTEPIKTLKVKTFNEIKDDLLLANYSADTSLQNLRQAILKRQPQKLSKENKLFKVVFKDYHYHCRNYKNFLRK